MPDKIYTLVTSPGIKRDGTDFEATTFTDGEWCRFQRGKPKKMSGARLLSAEPNDIVRGLLTHSINGTTYSWTGTKSGLSAFVTPTDTGIATGPFPISINNYSRSINIASIPENNRLLLPGDQTIRGTNLVENGVTVSLFDVADKEDYNYTTSLVSYDNQTDRTTVTLTPGAGSPTVVPSDPQTGEITPLSLQVFPDLPVMEGNRSDIYSWSFGLVYDPAGYAFRTIAHFSEALRSVDTTRSFPVFTGRLTPTTSDGDFEWEVEPLRDTAGQNPTGSIIEADGGVAAIYPFIFAFGSNGFIANNHVSSFDADSKGEYGTVTLNDWNGPTANQVNVAAGKILTAQPIRGGTSSPSGLFWATDALIRVSFTASAPLYWRYDLVSTDCSIISKDCVVQQDGIYYWVGVDRFYQYNGTVQNLNNDMNINYFFDNINLNERGKVFGVSVKRYNEIWWFYPHGDSTECNNAVIYNTKDKIWYDAGMSPLARRSAAVPANLFPYPIMASNDFEYSFGTAFELAASSNGRRAVEVQITDGGSGYNNHVIGQRGAASFASGTQISPLTITPVLVATDGSISAIRVENPGEWSSLPVDGEATVTFPATVYVDSFFPVSGGSGYTADDIGKRVEVDFADGGEIDPVYITINDVNAAGEINNAGFDDGGIFRSIPTETTVDINVPDSEGTGFRAQFNFVSDATPITINATFSEELETYLTIDGYHGNVLPGTFLTSNLDEPLGEVRTIQETIVIPGANNTYQTKFRVSPTYDEPPEVGDYIREFQGGYGLYQHEFGSDKVFYNDVTSIRSSFTTNDIGFIAGNPAQKSPVADNRQMKIFRVEPDFRQSGDMTLQYIGRGYSRGETLVSEEFLFTPETGKIDTRVQNRQMKLKFTSNDLGGDYEMGSNLIIAIPGDERA